MEPARRAVNNLSVCHAAVRGKSKYTHETIMDDKCVCNNKVEEEGLSHTSEGGGKKAV